MGEAKRRKAMIATRTWAVGSIDVVANDIECFGWSGTRQEAIQLQKRYLDTVNVMSMVSAHSYSARVAGYVMCYGMPEVGDVDLRPSNHGQRWNQIEVDTCKAALLWLALREHIPGSGKKLEDVFVGWALVVMFNGDRRQFLEATAREIYAGRPLEPAAKARHVDPNTPLPEDQFRMMVAVRDYDYRLDPRRAVSMRFVDLLALAGKVSTAVVDDDLIYVPRIPLDATEADAMLRMMTVFTDLTDPSLDLANPGANVRTYAGYTDDELRRGRPAVRIR
jgi:hypothetical protein